MNVNNDVKALREREGEAKRNISFDIVCRTRNAEDRGNDDWIDYRGISKIKFLRFPREKQLRPFTNFRST